MAVLANNARLIKVGKDYSAGSGISIDDYVISVTGEFGKTYSAGENIGIYEQDNQLYISGKDWTQDITNSYTSAVDWVSSQGYYIGNISTANSGSLYNINVNGLDVYGITSTSSDKHFVNDFSGNGIHYSINFNNPIQVGAYNTGTWSQWSASDTISFSSDGEGILPWSRPIKVKYIVVSNSVQPPARFSGDIGEISYEHCVTNAPFIKPSWLTSGAFIYLQFESEDTQSYGNLAGNSWSLSMGNVEGETISGLIINDDAEVNEFVYNNSASILDVDYTYQHNSGSYLTAHQEISSKLDVTAFSTVSGDFLTAFPSNMATTGDVAELAQTISETYQVKGDYLTTADSANFYPANNPSGFISGVDLSNYYTKDETSGADQLADAFANIPGGGGDAEVNSFVYNNSATINEVNTTYQANSGSYQPSGNYIPYTAVDTGINKAFETNSGLNIKKQDVAGLKTTRIDPTIIQLSYYSNGLIGDTDLTNNYLRFRTQTDSAYVDREKIHTWDIATDYIQNISATNDEVNTSYQSNSGTFLTAVDLTPYATTAEVDTLSSMLSGAIDYVSANVSGGVTGEFVPQSSFNELKQSYDALSSLFATFSGQWLLPNKGV